MKSLRSAVFALAALSSFALIACGDDASSGSGGSGASGTADVIYEAEATDEALEALLAASPVDNANEAAYLTSPVEGDVLAKASAPTFAWRVGPEATGALFAPSPERFGFTQSPTVRLPGWAQPSVASLLLGALATAQPAYAHGTPVNGRGYLLVIEDGSGAEVHRVFTLNLEHTPTQAAWDALASKSGPFSVSVLNAIFETNKVVPDGGPFQGPAVSFSVE